MNKDSIVWSQYQEADAFIQSIIDDFCRRNKDILNFSHSLFTRMGIRMIDIVDHLLLPDTLENRDRISKIGFQIKNNRCLCHGSTLPPIVLGLGTIKSLKYGLSIRVDRITDFFTAHGLTLDIIGQEGSVFRTCSLSIQNEVGFSLVERKMRDVYEPDQTNIYSLQDCAHCLEMWDKRDREVLSREHMTLNDESLYQHALKMAREHISLIGKVHTLNLFFQAERRYWLWKNSTAQTIKKDLDSLGIGWSMNDHHTYRCSRKNFHSLITFFRTLGFTFREKFYAGSEAQWGAQILEHPDSGIVLFCDIDMTPEERNIDLEIESLVEKKQKGTIGMWCSLHGDSFLQAGLHHVALRCDFTRIQNCMRQKEIVCMNPFSSFSYLKQAFTKGAIWKIDSKRLDSLKLKKIITASDATKYSEKGALGSHVEIIERNHGFKGFNQQSVSAIIKETNPGNHLSQDRYSGLGKM